MARIAAAQMASTGSLEDNFSEIEQALEQAKHQKADMLVLPEECLTLGMSDQEKKALSRTPKILEHFSLLAKKHKMWVVAGSIPTQGDNSHYFATSIVWDEKGEQRAEYHKIHLFDVEVTDGVSYHESNQVKPGSEVVTLQTPVGKVGLSICYDVRFPELYRALSQQGAEVILVPSAFTPQTGAVHWDTLIKARAIENLCYVVAPNQIGERPNGEGTYGHSLIVNPWGETLAEQEKGTNVIVADIDLTYLKRVRERFPALTHRKDFF